MMDKQVKRILKFEGIDYWSRPVFKDEFGNRFGSTDILFDNDISGEAVLKKVSEKDIYYFGTSFDCEPQGDSISPNKIKLII